MATLTTTSEISVPSVPVSQTFNRHTVTDPKNGLLQTVLIETAQEITLTQDATRPSGSKYVYLDNTLNVSVFGDVVTIEGKLSFPGKNVSIVARKLILDIDAANNRAAIVVDGPPLVDDIQNPPTLAKAKDGIDGGWGTGKLPGQHGWSAKDHPEMNGQNGNNGAKGNHGGTVKVVCGSVSVTDAFAALPPPMTPEQESYYRMHGGPPPGRAPAVFSISVRGGPGGNGQNGQAGGDGGDGGNGATTDTNVYQAPRPTAGGNGGDGGHGGHGGAAGLGGVGGTILVYVVQDRPFTSRTYLVSMDARGGVPGRIGNGGDFGKKGKRGLGGKGGWVVTFEGGYMTPSQSEHYDDAPDGHDGNDGSPGDHGPGTVPLPVDGTGVLMGGEIPRENLLQDIRVNQLVMMWQTIRSDYVALDPESDQDAVDNLKARLDWVASFLKAVPQEVDDFSLVQQVLPEVMATQSNLSRGVNFFGLSQYDVPAVSASLYRTNLTGDLPTLKDAEDHFNNFFIALRDSTDASDSFKNALAQAKGRHDGLNKARDDLHEKAKTELGNALTQQEGSCKELKRAAANALQNFSEKVHEAFGLSAETFLSCLSQLAFTSTENPVSAALMVGSQVGTILDEGRSNIISDDDTIYKKDYILESVQMFTNPDLTADLQTFKDRIDDKASYKALASYEKLKTLIAQFVQKTPGAEAAKDSLQKYIDSITERNGHIDTYNGALRDLLKTATEQDRLKLEIDRASQGLTLDTPGLTMMTNFVFGLYETQKNNCLEALHLCHRAQCFYALSPFSSFYETVGRSPQAITYDQITKARSDFDSDLIKRFNDNSTNRPAEFNSIFVVLTPKKHKKVFDDLALWSEAQFHLAPATKQSPAPVKLLTPAASAFTGDVFPPVNTPNPFTGMANVRITKFRAWMVGMSTSDQRHRVRIEHSGEELLWDPDDNPYPAWKPDVDGSAPQKMADVPLVQHLSADLPFVYDPTGLKLDLNWINFAQFSPDGRRVVTASNNGIARLWDATTGEAIGEPMEHSGPVNFTQFSYNSEHVVTASQDGTARMWHAWDATAGKPGGEAMRHKKGVSCARFSPEGQRVVTASEDNTARVWDPFSGTPFGEPMKHDGAINTVSFSPDGERVVTASEDNSARVWDAHYPRDIPERAETGRPVGEPMKHEGNVVSAQFSPDSHRVVTGSADGTARLWDAATGSPIGEPMQHEDQVASVEFSPDGRWIVTGSYDNTARVWDTATGKPVGEPMEHQREIYTAHFSPDGQRVLTASEDNTARVWDALTGTPISEPIRHHGAIYAACFSPDGKRVVTASEDNTARVWDAATGRPICEPMTHDDKFEFTPGKVGKEIPGTQDVDLQFSDAQELGLPAGSGYASIGPFTTWTLRISPITNAGLDLSKMTAIVMEFDGFSQAFN
jgi:WD40 repeat protein